MPVIEADIRDVSAVVRRHCATHPVDAVIHFAALKAVGESEADPLLYYDMNIIGTIRLLQAMQDVGVAPHRVFLLRHGLRPAGQFADP